MLSVENLGKRYGSRWIFKDLTFQLGQSDCLVVFGANGSGKSTLLKVIAGLVRPSEGTTNLDEDSLRSTLGYAALDGAVYPYLTVAEHLGLTAKLRGIESSGNDLLRKVGLHKAGDVFGSHLSTGMRSRLKLAMAIQCKPQILLLDEPGAALDEKGRALVEEILSEQRGRGCAIVASNDPREGRFATHELVLD